MDISFSIGTDCNLNCSYCYLPNKFNEKYDLTYIKKCKKLIETIKILDINRVAFIGAEVLTVPIDILIETINLFYDLSKNKIILVSNGSLITEEFLKSIETIKNKVKFSITIDGPEHIHNKHRGLYKETINGLNLLFKYKILTTLQIDITRDILDNLCLFDEWLLNMIEPLNFPYQIKFIYGDFKDSFENLPDSKKIEFAQWIYDTNRTKYVQTLNSNMCYRFSKYCSGFSFDIEGNVYTCNKTNSKGREVGNIYQTSIPNISYKRHYYFQKKHYHEDCLKCDIREICNGGCAEERKPYEKAIDCVFKLQLYKRFSEDNINFIEWFYNNQFTQTTEPQVKLRRNR